MKRTGATIHHDDQDDDDQETGLWCWVCGDDDHNPRPSCIDD
ncbi:hypothetical protein ACFFWA_15420 [Actinomadura verrucosospora]